MSDTPLVHLVAGGTNQLPILRAAKSLGYRVLVTDMYSDPPCRGEADEFVQVDVANRAATLEVAHRFGVHGVLTDQTDVAVPTVALIAEELGLPGIGFETALRFTNKELMRSSLAGCATFRLPNCYFFEEVNRAVEFVRSSVSSTGCWIAKPVNSQGSRGVARLDGTNDDAIVIRAFEAGRQKGVLVEEFIEGDEYSVESFVSAGVHHNLAVTRKYHYEQNDCIDERNTYLGDVERLIEEALFSATDELADTLNPALCSMHTEYKVHDGEVFLIETAARGAGGNISGKLIPFLTGFDPSVALVKAAVGEPVAVEYGDYNRRSAILRFFDFSPGVVSSIWYDEQIASVLMHFELNVTGGDEIRKIRDSRDRPGYFIAAGDRRDAVLREEQQFLDSFKIRYTES